MHCSGLVQIGNALTVLICLLEGSSPVLHTCLWQYLLVPLPQLVRNTPVDFHGTLYQDDCSHCTEENVWERN